MLKVLVDVLLSRVLLMGTPALAAKQGQLANLIAQAVQDSFRSLPKTGKPQPHEHTVLAGIVAYQTAAQDAPLGDSCSNCLGSSSNCIGALGSPVTFCHVVALGTGTKCLGGSQRSAAGDVLNDSHAEAITRRTFVVWLYNQLTIAAKQHQNRQQAQQHQDRVQQQAVSGEQSQQCSSSCISAFDWCSQASKFKLQPGIKFAMFVSQPPCGDASIYDQPAQQHPQLAEHGAVEAITEQEGGEDTVSNRQPPQPGGRLQQQRRRASAGKTGAKLIRLADAADIGQAAGALVAEQQQQSPAPDLQAAGKPVQQGLCQQQQQQHQQEQVRKSVPCVPTAVDFETGAQQLGALRRKPGKGDPTLSLSCSDKIARWACLGLQGCLLSSCLAEPIYLDMLVVAVPGVPAAVSPVAAADGAANSASKGSGPAATPGGQADDNSRLDSWHKQLLAVEAAGQRAVHSRLVGCCRLLEPHFRVQPPSVVAVPAADSRLGLYSDINRKVPSGSSVNWNCQLPLLSAWAAPVNKASAAAGAHEATLAATGRKLGAAKKVPSGSNTKTRSRLCSAAMFERWLGLLSAVPQLQLLPSSLHEQDSCPAGPEAADSTRSQFTICTYRRRKQQDGQKYQAAWAALRQGPSVFAKWLHKW